MRAVRIMSLMILPLLVLASMPHATSASDAQTIRKTLAKQPFKNLPGVRLPQKLDDEPATACTSHIGRDFWSRDYGKGGYRPRLARRVYRCDVDNVTVESTRRPDEVDWKKQKRYYKPWIDDGFDR